MPKEATEWKYNEEYSNIVDAFAALIECNENNQEVEE